MFFKRFLFVQIISIIIIFSLQCSSFNNKDTFYSDAETDVLEKTLSALDYGYGYDYQMELYYIYSYSFSKDNSDKKEKSFSEIIDKSDFNIILSLYQKILKIQAVTDYKLKKYQKEAKWNYYTFIKNNLNEPLNNYSSLLLKYILKKNSGLEPILSMKKESITLEVEKEYTSQDEVVDTF